MPLSYGTIVTDGAPAPGASACPPASPSSPRRRHVVAGDVAYNGVHQYVLEGAGGGLEPWLAAADTVEALDPSAVVAGHKYRDRPDSPAILAETRTYLRDLIRLLATTPKPVRCTTRCWPRTRTA